MADTEQILKAIADLDKKVDLSNQKMDSRIVLLEDQAKEMKHEIYGVDAGKTGIKADNIRHNDQEAARKWMTRTALAASVTVLAERALQWFKSTPHP